MSAIALKGKIQCPRNNRTKLENIKMQEKVTSR